MDIFQETQDKLRRLMNVPENYRILFLQTGASGQFSARVPIRSRDEIGAVSADFNAMAARMEDTVVELRQAGERQERFATAISPGRES